jgi:hypothetical protein
MYNEAVGKGIAALIALVAACGSDEDQGPCLEATWFADFTDDFDRDDASARGGSTPARS